MNILVIKHGALGDIILAAPAFAAIRAAHAHDEITLLTTAPFVPFLSASPWFDRVIADAKPKVWDISGVLKLRAQLSGFDMVYDLQTSSRSSRYFALAGKPRWSGIAPGCALPDANKQRDFIHTRERLAGQLAVAGITPLLPPDFSWVSADISRFMLPPRFVVLVPGAAPHRPEKRWPEAKFAVLAAQLPMQAVVVGTRGEAGLASIIRSFAPQSMDLTGQTNLLELLAVIKQANLAVGNDTGPMHMAAALGVTSLVMFSSASDPKITAPRYPDGGWPTILQAPHLADLSVAQIVAALP
ncbi:MAG: ADP-heptose--LPS heptosyltransferase [Acidocella sp. 20-57-95]|nr:MAG: ADP-heptose--LPS heptosyltransferase [Acidocella sp. 20-57-95]OYV58689.1 MAG: ADP-heptose--LPS heptosyltransferase [Acidocella sp. 21-58-7]HQT64707.1 glycosyltransferase family 9 protein [Acidocella sp.]HQU05536.1 glycosyltransferase family 9 protein [Acidocella sp.]